MKNARLQPTKASAPSRCDFTATTTAMHECVARIDRAFDRVFAKLETLAKLRDYREEGRA